MKLCAFVQLFLLGCSARYTHAINAIPSNTNITLPNGVIVATKIKGDEFMRWVTTSKDYTVVTGTDGYLYYGKQALNGRVVTTGVRVDLKPAPSGLAKDIRPTPDAQKADCKGKICEKVATTVVVRKRNLRDASKTWQDRNLALKSGKVYNLVIPIRFEDHHDRILPTVDQLSILMNNNGSDTTYCPTGSVRDVFKYNSFGQLNLTSVVADWVNVTGTEAYWANGDSGLTTLTHDLIRQALALADPSIDFSQFNNDGDSFIDAITFLHSGYGAEWGGSGYTNRMWSHKWEIYSGSGAFTSSEGVKVYDYHISPALWGTSGNNIGHVGVIAHELGHFLGLPDMYDGTDGQGVGSWDLMGNSWGFANNQLYPPHMSVFTRASLGWDMPVTIETDGAYTLAAAEDQNPAYPRGYKVTKNFPAGEYLLIENRQKLYFDSKIPTAGLVIYHVDSSASYTTEGFPNQTSWPGNGMHYKVAVLPADGRYDLEKNVNRGDGGDVWTPSSVGITYSSDPNPLNGPNFPNTDAYQGGVVYKTYISISNITVSGKVMKFQLKIGSDTLTGGGGTTSPPAGIAVSQPTSKPTVRPTRQPSPKPTRKPTSKPTARPTRKPTQKPTRKPTAKPTQKPTTPCLVAGSACTSKKQCCSNKWAKISGGTTFVCA